MTFLGGGVFGAVLGHFLALGRDKRNQAHADRVARRSRKEDLLGFLNVWTVDLEANRKIVNANNVLESMSQRFDKQRRELITLATPIESDYSANQRNKFNKLVDDIKAMTPGGTDSDDGRERLITAIGTLGNFLRGPT